MRIEISLFSREIFSVNKIKEKFKQIQIDFISSIEHKLKAQ